MSEYGAVEEEVEETERQTAMTVHRVQELEQTVTQLTNITCEILER